MKPYTTILIGFYFLLISCNEKAQEKTESSPNGPVINQEPSITEVLSQQTVPLQVSKSLETTGTESDSASLTIYRLNFRNSNDTILAIGGGMIYSDAAYGIAFDQRPATYMFQKVNEITGRLFQLPSEIITDQNKKFGNNLVHRDTLDVIMQKIYGRTSEFVNQDNIHFSVLFVSSHILEDLYLSMHALNHYPMNMLAEDSRVIIVDPLLKTVMEQESSLERAISLLKKSQESKISQELYFGMMKIDSTFDMLNIEEKMRNNQSYLVLGDSTLRSVAEQTSSLRNHIVDLISN